MIIYELYPKSVTDLFKGGANVEHHEGGGRVKPYPASGFDTGEKFSGSIRNSFN